MKKIIDELKIRGSLDDEEIAYSKPGDFPFTLDEFREFEESVHPGSTPMPYEPSEYRVKGAYFETYVYPFEYEGEQFYMQEMFGQGSMLTMFTAEAYNQFVEELKEFNKDIDEESDPNDPWSGDDWEQSIEDLSNAIIDDAERLTLVLEAKGHKISVLDAKILWLRYSDDNCAGWMMMSDLDDDEVYRHIKDYLPQPAPAPIDTDKAQLSMYGKKYTEENLVPKDQGFEY
jgi:hypothetical protein